MALNPLPAAYLFAMLKRIPSLEFGKVCPLCKSPYRDKPKKKKN